MRVTGKRSTQTSLAIALALCASLPAHACWHEAAVRYQVNSNLLQAIATTESAMNPRAVGRNRNGSRDIGLMQINSVWLPTLAAHGITERDLFEPCTNIHVGAWVLAGNVSRLGYTWEAVGAYNAVSPTLRRAYIEKVRRHLRRLLPHPFRRPAMPSRDRSGSACSRNPTPTTGACNYEQDE